MSFVEQIACGCIFIARCDRSLDIRDTGDLELFAPEVQIAPILGTCGFHSPTMWFSEYSSSPWKISMSVASWFLWSMVMHN
jgi:hypothetical protein